jgi:hypothetical protein
MNFFKAILASLVISLSTFTHAGLISTGIGAADTENNLEWMNFTQTVNLSYWETLNEFTAGGDFEGWRFANKNDIKSLFANAGSISSNFDGSYDGNGFDGASELILDLLGYTSIVKGVYRDVSVSYTGNESPNELAGFYVRDWIQDDYFNILEIRDIMFATGDAEVGKSLALVRDYIEVPEPSTLAIFALGLMGLALRRLMKESQ